MGPFYKSISVTFRSAIFIFCVVALISQANASPISKTPGVKGLQEQKLLFTENKGQVTDMEGNARPDVLFSSGNSSARIFFTATGISYQFTKQTYPDGYEKITTRDIAQHKAMEKQVKNEIYRFTLSLAGADTHPVIRKEKKNAYTENFYSPVFPEGITGVATYERIVYENVYPNIDWIIYSDGQHLKYDLMVHPGGDPKQIRLKIDDAESVQITPAGELLMKTSLGEVKENAPVSFIDSKQIPTTFHQNEDGTIGFSVTPIAGKELRIDPSVSWATYYGGSGSDYFNGCAVGDLGNVYASGYTNSTTSIATSGGYQTSFGGNNDIVLAKFDGNGNRLWATYYGGTGDDEGTDCTADLWGNIYVTGYAGGAGLATSGAFKTSFGGADNAILIKFNAAGQRKWATYYGNVDDEGIGCKADHSGAIYMTGNTTSSSGIATSGSYQSLFTGGSAGFLVKFDSSGNRQWATYYGNSSTISFAVDLDASSNVYIGGQTSSSTGISSSGAYQTSLNGTADGFLAKFNSAGTWQWGTYIGGTSNDQIYGLATDPSNNIYVTGSTASSNGIATTGAYQTTLNGTSNAFLIKFSPSGSRIRGTYIGGNGNDACYSMIADSIGNICIVGITSSSNGIATSGIYQNTYGGGNDGFVVDFDSTCNRLWGTYLGGPNDDGLYGNAADNVGSIYVAGYAKDTGLATTGAYQTNENGPSDGILVKFASVVTTITITQPFTDTNKCAGSTITLPYTKYGPFVNGNVFTAQLSNASGSFTSPVNIGNITSMTAGTIICTIPVNTPTGTGYRIRIISSTPGDTSATDGVNIHISSLAQPTISNNSPVCVGDSIKLKANNANPNVTYQWTDPGGTVTGQQNRIISPAALANAGSYTLVVSYNACIDTNVVTVVVNPLPATLTTTNNGPLCSGSNLSLSTSTSTSPVTYNWTGPNFFSSNIQSPGITSVPITDSGKYYVTVTSNSGCSIKDSTHVSINTGPAITATFTSPICAGDSIHLHAAFNATGVTGYGWTGPAGFSALTNPTVSILHATASNAGSYIFSATRGGCTSYDTVTMVVDPLPAKPTISSNSPVCSGNTLSFNPVATTGATYSWTGPVFFTSTIRNATRVVSLIDSGYYIITATLNGCTAADTTHVTVLQAPNSVTYSSNGPICAGGTLQVISNNLTSGVTYNWTGPGGFSSSSQNFSIPNATVANSGNYTLTVAYNTCSVTNTLAVVVNPLPAKPVITSNSPLCAGTTLTLSPIGTTGATYNWAGPTGFSSTQQNTTRVVALTDSGNYVVTATLNGCTASDTEDVAVNVSPAGITYGSNSPICAGDTLKIVSNSTTPGVTYSWSEPSGSTNSAQNFNIPNAGVANSGKYALAITYSGCTVYDTVTTLVKPLPAVPTAGSNSPVCVASSLGLSSLSNTTGVTYSWTGPNGYTAATEYPVRSGITTAAAGSYTVTATLNGCSTSASTSVAVNPIPTGSVSSNSPVCAGATLSLSSSISPSTVSYSWSGPNGFTSSQQAPSLANTGSTSGGNYYLTATLGTCTAVFTAPVVIDFGGVPTVNIVVPSDTVCGGAVTSFTANVTNAGTSPTYTWRVNGVNTGASGSVFSTSTLNDGDLVTCSIVSNAPCQPLNTASSNSIWMHIKAANIPPIHIIVTPLHYLPNTLVTFTAISEGNANCLTYQWRRNGVDLQGATTSSYATFNLNEGDKISLHVHSICACADPDTVLTNIVNVAVNNVNANTSYKVFPNPAQNDVTIEGPDGNVQMEMYDMGGKKMWIRPVTFSGGIAKVHLALAAGIYTMHIADEKGNYYIERLIVTE